MHGRPPQTYTLSLHDALPISMKAPILQHTWLKVGGNEPGESTPYDLVELAERHPQASFICRSEEHTSELQSHSDLVCRLLLEKKNHGSDTSSQDSHTRWTT